MPNYLLLQESKLSCCNLVLLLLVLRLILVEPGVRRYDLLMSVHEVLTTPYDLLLIPVALFGEAARCIAALILDVVASRLLWLHRCLTTVVETLAILITPQTSKHYV